MNGRTDGLRNKASAIIDKCIAHNGIIHERPGLVGLAAIHYAIPFADTAKLLSYGRLSLLPRGGGSDRARHVEAEMRAVDVDPRTMRRCW